MYPMTHHPCVSGHCESCMFIHYRDEDGSEGVGHKGVCTCTYAYKVHTCSPLTHALERSLKSLIHEAKLVHVSSK